jgi:lipopolysaccharide biosynthesis protein
LSIIVYEFLIFLNLNNKIKQNFETINTPELLVMNSKARVFDSTASDAAMPTIAYSRPSRIKRLIEHIPLRRRDRHEEAIGPSTAIFSSSLINDTNKLESNTDNIYSKCV